LNKRTIGTALTLAFVVLAYLYDQGLIPGREIDTGVIQGNGQTSGTDDLHAIAEAYRTQRSDVQVRGEGIVTKLLRDDLDGSRHQRFLLRLDNNQTLLVAHNIDLAPRIDNLRKGDKVGFYGEYEWNNQGGVLHWTHRDPGGRHVDGWLKHQGRTYR
jgi:molybdopterin converting factor small subunit